MGDTSSLTMPFRLYAHGNDKYLADHVLALYEETNEASNGMKVVLWHCDEVAENADFDYEDGQLVSCKYPSHCLAVYEAPTDLGEGPNGFDICVWHAPDTGKNAK